MNILPLVFTFLLILSFITLTFLRETKSIFLIEHSVNGFRRIERVVNNQIVQKAYKKISGEAIAKKKTGEPKNKKKKKLHSVREIFPPLKTSKFNLGPLIEHQGEINQHPLYEVLAAFLRILYQKSLFAHELKAEKIEYRLIHAWIKSAQKIEDVEDLAELHPDDLDLAKVFYKMLRGTNQYTRTEGIPPLGDFLLISEKKTAVSLSFASQSLLEALFGEECASQIMQVEQKKREETSSQYYFPKENLPQLLANEPARAASLPTLDPYIDYSKEQTKRELVGKRDDTTGIAFEKNI